MVAQTNLVATIGGLIFESLFPSPGSSPIIPISPMVATNGLPGLIFSRSPPSPLRVHRGAGRCREGHRGGRRCVRVLRRAQQSADHAQSRRGALDRRRHAEVRLFHSCCCYLSGPLYIIFKLPPAVQNPPISSPPLFFLQAPPRAADRHYRRGDQPARLPQRAVARAQARRALLLRQHLRGDVPSLLLLPLLSPLLLLRLLLSTFPLKKAGVQNETQDLAAYEKIILAEREWLSYTVRPK